MRFEEREEPTPERLAKGGLRVHRDDAGNYLSATLDPDTVLGVLIDRGLVMPHLQDAADELHEWHRAFLAPVRYHPPRMGSQAVPGKSIAASRYVWLQAKLAPKTMRLVVNASTPGWVPDAIHPTATYRLAFERLADALHEARKEVTEATIRQQTAALLAKKL